MARTCRAVTGDLAGPNHSVCGRYKKVQQKEIGGPETAIRQQAWKKTPCQNWSRGCAQGIGCRLDFCLLINPFAECLLLAGEFVGLLMIVAKRLFEQFASYSDLILKGSKQFFDRITVFLHAGQVHIQLFNLHFTRGLELLGASEC